MSQISKEKFSRQLGILNPDDLKERVLVIGVGGIGSWTVDVLSRIGFTDITVFDDDVVSEANLGYQFYRREDVGKPKVEALGEIIESFSGVKIKPENKKYKGKPHKEVVICAVDDMKTRHAIWKKIKMKSSVRCYVDARMGMELMRLYTVNPIDPDSIKMYEEELYPPEEAVQLDCSTKGIAYNVLTIASFITNNIKKYILDGVYDKEIIFDLRTMMMIRR